MGLLGCKVKHAKFGVGEIVEVQDAVVVIDFNGNKKVFQKETLNKFFTFEDATANDFVEEILQEIKDKKEAEEEQKRSEEDKKIAKVVENIASCGAKISEGKDVISIRLDRASVRSYTANEAHKALIQEVF